jgi:hypothetical protein
MLYPFGRITRSSWSARALTKESSAASLAGRIAIRKRLSPLRAIGGERLRRRGPRSVKGRLQPNAGDPNDVFGGRKVYFMEDPDIKVVYCLVKKPDPLDTPEVRVTDPRFVDTIEMLHVLLWRAARRSHVPLTSQTRSSALRIPWPGWRDRFR